MGSGPTDSQLLKLLQDKLPVELSAGEIENLRKAIQTSPKVRDALVNSLCVDQGVATEMAPEAPGLDNLLELIDRRRNQAAFSRWRIAFSLLICALVCGCLVLIGTKVPGWLEEESPPIARQPNDADPNNQPADNTTVEPSVQTPDPDPDTPPEEPTETPDSSDPANESTPDQTGNETEQPSSTEAENNIISSTVQVPPAAAWRLYDNRAEQPSRSWRKTLQRILLPIGGAILRQPAERMGMKLDGTFAVACPVEDGPALRLNLDEVKRFQLSFWDDAGDGTIVYWHDDSSMLRGVYAHRPDGIKNLPPCPGKTNDIDQLRGKMFEQVDQTIDFNWRDGPPIGGKDDPEGFTVEWDGFLAFPEGGNWYFYTTTAGKVTIELEGKRILEKDASDEVETVESRIWTYGQDQNPFKVIYHGKGPKPSIRIEWARKATDKHTEIPRKLIPTSALTQKFVHLNENSSDKDEDIPLHVRNEIKGLRGRYRDSYRADILGNIETKHTIGNDGKSWRDNWNRGPIDIRYQQDAIRLSRGNVELLALPMKNPPSRCVLDTECNLQNAEWINIPPLQLDDESGLATTVESIDPSSLDWKLKADEPKTAFTIVKNEDGSLELTRNSGESYAELYTMFDIEGGFELTMKVDRMGHRSGIFLGDPAWENSQFRTYFMTRDGRWALCPDSSSEEEMGRSFERGREIGKTVWIRLTSGLNQGRVDFSTDGGENWRPAVRRHFDRERSLTSKVRLGIRFEHGPDECSLRISDFKLRRFHGLESLAEPADLAIAKDTLAKILDDIKKNENKEEIEDNEYEDWTYRIPWEEVLDRFYKSRPDDVSEDRWLLACDIVLLHSGTFAVTKESRIFDAIERAVKLNVGWDRLGPAIKEIHRRSLEQYYGYSWRMFDDLYDRLARRLWEAHREDEIECLVDAWYGRSFPVRGEMPAPTLPPGLLKYHLARLIQKEDWQSLMTAACREQYLAAWGSNEHASHRHPNRNLINVINATAIEKLGLAGATANDQTMDNPIVELDSFSRIHPVRFLMASRGAYEFIEKAALHIKDNELERAADELVLNTLTDSHGLKPIDDQWYVSSAIALRQVIESQPALRQAMASLEGIGKIRLKRGLLQDDPELLTSVAVQFHGMSPGYDAQLALANRKLVRGEFIDAAVRFEDLIDVAKLDLQASLRAKQRLAYAMTGRLVGQPITQAVSLGQESISSDQFERIVSRAANNRKQMLKIEQINQSPSPMPSSRRLRFDHLIRLDINKPVAVENDYYPYFSYYSLGGDDYFRRPTDLGLIIDDKGMLYRHQEGQIAAYSLNDRRTTFEKTEKVEVSHNPRNLAARPLIINESVVVPFNGGTHTNLTCFDQSNGKIRWQKSLDDMIVGSPVLAEGSILCLSIIKESSKLQICRVEPETGQILSSHVIADVYLGDLVLQGGQPIVEKNRCIFTVGSTVFCTDLQGKMNWARRLHVMPCRINRIPSLFYYKSDPISLGNRVLVTAPGSFDLECLNIEDGRQIWQLTHPELRLMVGKTDDRVILATENTVIGVDILTGKIVWSQRFSGDPRRVAVTESSEVCLFDFDQENPEVLHITRYQAVDGKPLPTIDLNIPGASNEPASDASEEVPSTKMLGLSSRVVTLGRYVFYIRIVGKPDNKKLEIVVLK